MSCCLFYVPKTIWKYFFAGLFSFMAAGTCVLVHVFGRAGFSGGSSFVLALISHRCGSAYMYMPTMLLLPYI